MSGGKIPNYIKQATEAEAKDAAVKAANAYPRQPVNVAGLGERLARLEARVLELERFLVV